MRNYVTMVLFLFILSVMSAVILTAFHVQTKELIDQNRQQERVLHILKATHIIPDSVANALANEVKNLPESTEKERFDKVARSIELTQSLLKKCSVEERAQAFENIQILEIIPNNTFETKVHKGLNFLALPSQSIDYIHNIYIFQTETPEGKLYCFEVSGSGFWDKVSGYLVLHQGLNRIKGISFFDHKETPGLGQRIEEGWFQAQFVVWHKQVMDTHGKIALHVTKRDGLYDGDSKNKSLNEVDAITGASETSRALDRFIPGNIENLLVVLQKLKNDPKVKDFFDAETLAVIERYVK